MKTVDIGPDRTGGRGELRERRGVTGYHALGVAVVVGLGVALVASGCRKKNKDPVAPTATYPSASTTAPLVPVAPPPAVTPSASAASEPVPVFDEATKLALGAMIDARATKEAPGMKPVGELFGGAVPSGGQVESPLFMVEQAKCYIVLAQAGLGVTELDIKLLGGAGLVAPGFEPILAVDNTSGSAAAITPCWRPLLGGPSKVSLLARTGAGAVAAKIYAK
ncbi:MAG: hypothetical protein JW751_24175 [Polyangiaceae bacterium]|nr:hypothetical protein [Polyangiaceae bacterium]